MNSTKQIIQNTHTIVANRMKYIADIIDWDSIETICDIGSWHLGQSIEFLELLPDAKIYAFEANPDNYKMCQDIHSRLTGYFKKNLTVFNTALNNESGTIKFYQVADENPGASSKFKFMQGLTEEYFDKSWKQKEIQVNATTLDNWRVENNIEKVDIIWIDVQGAELDVFEGGRETLKDVKCIFTEVGLKPYYEGQALKSQIDFILTEENDFVEITESFEYNGSDCEGNTIYVRKDLF
jgi:FkbM family methyltransferase